MFDQFRKSAAMCFFVNFRYFTTNGCLTFRSENRGKIRERFHETKWRFVENHTPCFLFKCMNSCLSSLFLRKKAFKAEPVRGERRVDQSRDEGGRPGESLDRDSTGGTLTDKHETRVGNGGCSRIRDQSYVLAGKNPLGKPGGCLMLVEFVMGRERGMDVVMVKEDTGGPRILGKHQIDLLEQTQSPQGNVLKVADRGWYDI